ncbi:MAG: hypothetical protein KGL39_53445 [Patescibacteria group bacterium]|nr:hypothetical protein [Patescibacteria group bacterium]
MLPETTTTTEIDITHLRGEVEALRDLITHELLVFTPENVVDCLDHILREIDGQGWRIRQIGEVAA